MSAVTGRIHGLAISGIGYALGESIPIESLSARGVDARAIRELRDGGFVNFCESRANIAELAVDATSMTFCRAGIPPEQIESVLFSTESLWDGRGSSPRTSRMASHLQVRNDLICSLILNIGIRNAQVYANWMTACSNLVTSTNLAASLVASKAYGNALVVVTDRRDQTRSRVMENGASVFSDAAASFIVSNSDTLHDRSNAYLVKDIVTQTAAPAMIAWGREDMMAQVREMLRALAEFRHKVIALTGKSMDDYDIIVGDNYSSVFYEMVVDALGFSREKLHCPTKAEFAHASAVDTIISLDRLRESGHLANKQSVALLNIGPWSLGLTALEVGPGRGDRGPCV